MRNKFIDRATGNEYEWPINHKQEDEFGKRRNIEQTANTGNTGHVRQQGSKSPLSLKLQGTILTRDFLFAMRLWFELCEDQTIEFHDYTGQQYEVIITAFNPTRVRGQNHKDPVYAPNHYWTYSIEMDVVRVLTWEGWL